MSELKYRELTDRDIATMMKLALEYNAGIVAQCTLFYGNVDAKPNQDKLRKSLMKLSVQYRESLIKVINGDNEPMNEKDDTEN